MHSNLKEDIVKEKLLNDFAKRVFDLVASFIAIILLSPIFLMISIIIKIDSKGPILFKQIRVGKNEEEFNIYKFRTMVVNADKLGKQITVGKDQRITRSGHFLRKYKLDELPQLLNVLNGEMSFVGPRPEVPKYTQLYNNEQRRIFTVRPGITDYASVKYRSENEILAMSSDPEKTYIEEVMQDKLRINMEYLKRRSIFEDLKIIFITIFKIIN